MALFLYVYTIYMSIAWRAKLSGFSNIFIGLIAVGVLFFGYVISGADRILGVSLGFLVATLITNRQLFHILSEQKTKQRHSQSSIKLTLSLLFLVFLLTVFATPLTNLMVRFLKLDNYSIYLFVPFWVGPYVLSYVFSYMLVTKLASQLGKLSVLKKLCLVAFWTVYSLYTSSITLSIISGNAYTPGGAMPMYVVGFGQSNTRESVRLLRPHLKWYDRLLLVTVIGPFDGSENGGSPEDGICMFNGKEQSPHFSLPTRTFLGLYYKNYLITCNKVDFAVDEGIGSYLPR